MFFIINFQVIQQVQQVQGQQIIGTPVVVAQRPVQQPTVTHIRIQPQPAASVLQRRGLALTVSLFTLLLMKNEVFNPN